MVGCWGENQKTEHLMYYSKEPWRRPIEIPHLPPLACGGRATVAQSTLKEEDKTPPPPNRSVLA